MVSESESGSDPAACTDGAAAIQAKPKQINGRARRPGKAKAMKPPLSKNTGAATGGTAAQRRLNEKAGIENGERRRRSARDGDSPWKQHAGRAWQRYMIDYEHQHGRVESREL